MTDKAQANTKPFP